MSQTLTPTVAFPAETSGAVTSSRSGTETSIGVPPPHGPGPTSWPPERPVAPTMPSSSETEARTVIASPSLYGLPGGGARTVATGGWSSTTSISMVRWAEFPDLSVAVASSEIRPTALICTSKGNTR